MTRIDTLMWMGKVQEALTLLKICRQLRNANSGRNGLPQGKTHELMIQYQKVNPEYIHADNIRTDKAVFLYFVTVKEK